MSTKRKVVACRPKKPAPRTTPTRKAAAPTRPALAYEPSIRFLGRWVPGFHDY